MFKSNKVIVYEIDAPRPHESAVRVVVPAPKYMRKLMASGMTEMEALKSIAKKDAAENYRIVDRSKFPSDRTFRNAWTDKNPTTTIDVDMPKACDIQMDKIRVARNARLTELDKRLYGDSFDAERTKLRDIPETFDLSKAKTPEALKKLWPTELA